MWEESWRYLHFITLLAKYYWYGQPLWSYQLHVKMFMLLRTTRHRKETMTFQHCYCSSVGWIEPTAVTQETQYGSLSSFSEDPASTPQAATLWEPCWDCLWAVAQELWMDHSDISHWASCCGSPARSGRAVGSTALTQSRSCVQRFCHTDQHSWHGVWASIKLYLWSETVWQALSHEARQCKAIAHQSFFSLGKMILCKTDSLHHAVVPFLAG